MGDDYTPAKYHFDNRKADLVCEFVETQLCHVDGPLGGKPFILADWQEKTVRDVFGWQDKDGLRKYRHLWLECAVRQGKTTFVAALLAWCLFCEPEYGQQIYSAACTKEQAGLIFSILRRQIEANPALDRRCHIIPTTRFIETDTGAIYKALPADSRNIQGLNCNVIACDEVAEYKTRELVDSLVQRTGSRAQPLVIYSTTAGHDRRSIAWELHSHALQCLADPEFDPRFYPVVFAAPDDADPLDFDSLRPANPNLGSAVQVDYLRQELDRAKRSPLYLNSYRKRHLCQWVESETRAIDQTQWQAGHVETMPDFPIGTKATLAFDLSNCRDLTSVCVAVQHEGKTWLYDHSFIPAERMIERERIDRVPYSHWSSHVTATPGNVVDYATVKEYILRQCQRWQIHSIGYDPWQSVPLIIDLTALGLNMVKIRQGFASISAPLKEFDGLIAGGLLRHCSPVLDWQSRNLCVISDNNSNIRPSKPRWDDPARIDGLVAAIMAVSLLPKRPEIYRGEVLLV